MRGDYQTIKIYRSTLRALRLLAALREQPMTKVLDDLVTEALAKAHRLMGAGQEGE